MMRKYLGWETAFVTEDGWPVSRFHFSTCLRNDISRTYLINRQDRQTQADRTGSIAVLRAATLMPMDEKPV